MNSGIGNLLQNFTYFLLFPSGNNNTIYSRKKRLKILRYFDGEAGTGVPHDHPCDIQGVSRLYHITAGGDFLGLCDEKISYKHVSDFGRLRSYDRLNLRIEGNDY